MDSPVDSKCGCLFIGHYFTFQDSVLQLGFEKDRAQQDKRALL